MNTDKDNGLAVWCNNCQDFPDEYNLRSYSDGHAILRCGECGETEVVP
jgi:hypothetical protein